MLSAFAVAAQRGWTSVSFPAVSSGIFGVPAKVWARAYLTAAKKHFDAPSPLARLRPVLVEGQVADVFREYFNRRG